MKIRTVLLLAALLYLAACDPSAYYKPSSDPLQSWNDGGVKSAIIEYVMAVTDPQSEDFIPQSDRIAVFDNDGTLVAEKPVLQVEFAVFTARKMIAEDPRTALEQPFRAIAGNDMEYLSSLSLRESFAFSCMPMNGLTPEAYAAKVNEFLDYGVYPGLSCPISATRYKPQLELIEYLHRNGFTVYICTGSTADFVMALSERLFGIDPSHVIGSRNRNRFVDSVGVAAVYLSDEMEMLNNKALKPLNIHYAVGRRPVLACGNEGGAGDVDMLRYSQGSSYRSLQLIVNHDDARREFEYSEDPDVSLDMARRYGWQIISIKEDWKTVFAD